MHDSGGVVCLSNGIMEREKTREHAIKISLPYLVSLYPQPALPPIPRQSYSPSSNLSSVVGRRKRNGSGTRSRGTPFIVTNTPSQDYQSRSTDKDGCDCQDCRQSSGSNLSLGDGSKKYGHSVTKVHVVEASSSSFGRGWSAPRRLSRHHLLTPISTPSHITLPTTRLNNTPEDGTPPLSPPSPLQRRSIFSSLVPKQLRSGSDRIRPPRPIHKSRTTERGPISLGDFAEDDEEDDEPIPGRPGMDFLWILLQKVKECWSPDEDEVEEMSESKSNKGKSEWDWSRSPSLSSIHHRNCPARRNPASCHPLQPPSFVPYCHNPTPRRRALSRQSSFEVIPTQTRTTINTDDLPITTSIPLLPIEYLTPKSTPTKTRKIPISPLVPSPSSVSSRSTASTGPRTSSSPSSPTPSPRKSKQPSPKNGIQSERLGTPKSETELRIQVLEWSMVKSGKLCGVRSRVVSVEVRDEIV